MAHHFFDWAIQAEITFLLLTILHVDHCHQYDSNRCETFCFAAPALYSKLDFKDKISFLKNRLVSLIKLIKSPMMNNSNSNVHSNVCKCFVITVQSQLTRTRTRSVDLSGICQTTAATLEYTLNKQPKCIFWFLLQN